MIKFFSGLFGDKGGAPKAKPISLDVIATAAAQPHVLREKMKEKKLTHGETVTASVSPVRLEIAREKVAMYFCPMKTLEVSETHAPGDGNDIPGQVNLEGLKVPADFLPGLYTLKNVTLSSNGVMTVTATNKTIWEKVEATPAL
jgi:hypothetical protein